MKMNKIRNTPSEMSSTHCVIYKQFYSDSCQEIENADEYSYVYLSVPRGKRKFFSPYLINRKEVIKLTTSYDIAPLSWSCFMLVFIHLFWTFIFYAKLIRFFKVGDTLEKALNLSFLTLKLIYIKNMLRKIWKSFLNFLHI